MRKLDEILQGTQAVLLVIGIFSLFLGQVWWWWIPIGGTLATSTFRNLYTKPRK